MNILKDNLSGIASKRAYTAPMMEVVVMDHHMDLLNGSPTDEVEAMGVEEE